MVKRRRATLFSLLKRARRALGGRRRMSGGKGLSAYNRFVASKMPVLARRLGPKRAMKAVGKMWRASRGSAYIGGAFIGGMRRRRRRAY